MQKSSPALVELQRILEEVKEGGLLLPEASEPLSVEDIDLIESKICDGKICNLVHWREREH